MVEPIRTNPSLSNGKWRLDEGRSRDVARAGWVVAPGMTFPLEETELILCPPVWLRGAVGGQLPLTPEAM